VDHCDKDIGGCPEGTALLHPGSVGRFRPNPFGLFDMTSNVSEWTLDCWNGQHDKFKVDLDPRLKGDCQTRVIKGGGYYYKSGAIRISLRNEGIEYKSTKSPTLGFRVVRSLKNH